MKLPIFPLPLSLPGEGLKTFEERGTTSLGIASPCATNLSDFARDRCLDCRGGAMLEETTPAYSYLEHRYVPNRTYVWHSSCRRSLCPSVTFSHRRKTPWVPRCQANETYVEDVCAEFIPSTRTEAGWAKHHPMSVLCRRWQFQSDDQCRTRRRSHLHQLWTRSSPLKSPI